MYLVVRGGPKLAHARPIYAARKGILRVSWQNFWCQVADTMAIENFILYESTTSKIGPRVLNNTF